MNTDIKSDKILNNWVVKKYKDSLIEGLTSSFPMLYPKELSDAIDWVISNHHSIKPGKLHNNYTMQTITGDVIDILNYIKKLNPILCSSGVLFQSRQYSDNPFDRMLQKFLSQRGVYKAEMKKAISTHGKNSYEYEKYNLLQLLEKINANGGYGLFGAPTCLFYNIYLAESVTFGARAAISSSTMFFESFLANNIKFNSLNEVITFIHNVRSEKPDRKYGDDIILERPIEHAECFYKIMRSADPMIWIPTEFQLSLVWDIIRNLDQENLNRLYYKNNLYAFCDLPVITDIIITILKTLQGPYVDPNSPPKEIKEQLDIFVDLLKEYVYYKHPYIDKLDRIEYSPRNVIALSDTDSSIISFDAWYRFILEKTYFIDMNIKRRKYDICDLEESRNDSGDLCKRQMYTLVEPVLDYDFHTDEIIEVQRKREMYTLIPQDSLRYAIINILAYTCDKLVKDYLSNYCDLNGSRLKDEKCFLSINLIVLY